MTTNPPEHLGAHGKKLFEDITADLDLRPDELEILTVACHELDVVKRLEKAVDELESFRVKGSRNQDVAAPELAELRAHSMTFASLISRLKISDEPSENAKPKTPFQVAQSGGKARAAKSRRSA